VIPVEVPDAMALHAQSQKVRQARAGGDIVTREADNPKGDDLSRIKRNAKRLLRDAKLLSDNERHASAFALAVLGLEEIGKSILRQWNL
jgi:hypothetical protein